MEYYWPQNLPMLPLRDDYSQGLPNNVTRTDMDFGPAKLRRRTSANMRPLSLTYILKRNHKLEDGTIIDQKALFEEFISASQAMPFWLPDPLDSTRYIKVRLKADDEDSLVSLSPIYSEQWSVTLDLEVYPYAVKLRN